MSFRIECLLKIYYTQCNIIYTQQNDVSRIKIFVSKIFVNRKYFKVLLLYNFLKTIYVKIIREKKNISIFKDDLVTWIGILFC